jgi:Zn-finger nucleic acid-binding protein
MRIFGIAVTPPLYGLNWLLSAAQVELLAIDTCVLVTNHDSKTSGKSKDGKPQPKAFKSPSLSRIEEVIRRWKAKYEGRENEKIQFKDVF